MTRDRMFHVIVLGGMGLVACGGLTTGKMGSDAGSDGASDAAADGPSGCMPQETPCPCGIGCEPLDSGPPVDAFPSELPARVDAFPSESDPAPDAFPTEGPVLLDAAPLDGK